jgi:hypothetical protein
MNRKNLRLAGFIAFIVLILNFQLAFATQGYRRRLRIEIGWVNEPPIVATKFARRKRSNTSGASPAV